MVSAVSKSSVAGAVSPSSSKMLYVIFFSLLMDLLAFTVILPLMPALMEYYQKHDSPNGLYSYCVNLISDFRSRVGAPEKFDSVLFAVSSSLAMVSVLIVLLCISFYASPGRAIYRSSFLIYTSMSRTGFLGSMFSFLQFIVSPLVGGLSDAYGRKPILILSLCGIILSYALWALSGNFAVFVAARVIGGLSKGNVSLSMAIITDVSNTTARAAGMALVGIAFSVGFILGPLIGALFSRWAAAGGGGDSPWFIYPALFALTLSILDLIFILLFFEETLPKGKRSKSVADSLGQALGYIHIIDLFKFSAVRNLSDQGRSALSRLGCTYFAYLFLYSGLEFTLTFLTHHYFEFTPLKQGTMFFWIGLTMALLQGSYVRRIPTSKVKSAAFLGLLLIIPSYVAVGAASTEILLYFGLFLYAVSTAFVVPCLTTLASQFGDDDKKGRVLGVFRSLGALARGLGPIVASIAFWSCGATATYITGAVLLIWPCYALKSTKFKQE